MNSSDNRRFSGKVYSRRNHKNNKKLACAVFVESSAGGAVIVGMEKRFSGKVYSRRNRKTQGVSLAISTSGNVPNGGVETSFGGALVGRTPIPKNPNTKDDPKKREMTIEETRKLIRDLENLPPEELGAFAEMVKKRGITLTQNNEELELDLDSVDTETLWELERFITNYKKSSNTKRKPKVASARADSCCKRAKLLEY